MGQPGGSCWRPGTDASPSLRRANPSARSGSRDCQSTTRLHEAAETRVPTTSFASGDAKNAMVGGSHRDQRERAS